MKKIYRIETLDYWMIATYDGETVRYITDSNDFDAETFPLAEVEDDSSWEMVENTTLEKFLYCPYGCGCECEGCESECDDFWKYYNDCDAAKITEEAEAKC